MTTKANRRSADDRTAAQYGRGAWTGALHLKDTSPRPDCQDVIRRYMDRYEHEAQDRTKTRLERAFDCACYNVLYDLFDDLRLLGERENQVMT